MNHGGPLGQTQPQHPPSIESDSPALSSLTDPFNPSLDSINEVLRLFDLVRHKPNFSSTTGPIVTMSLSARVVELGNGNLLKCGGKVKITEAMAMEYVRRTTTIPVPKVHIAFHHAGWGYIVMDLVKCETLEGLAFTMSPLQLNNIALQLADYVLQLSGLGRHQTMGSWPSGPYRNFFFTDPQPEREFTSISEFHAYWASKLKGGVFPQTLTDLNQSAPNSNAAVLSHGDLGARNILVREGRIVAIVDWETFGWYPDFWEYMLAYRGSWAVKWKNALVVAFGEVPQSAHDYLNVLHDVFVKPYV